MLSNLTRDPVDVDSATDAAENLRAVINLEVDLLLGAATAMQRAELIANSDRQLNLEQQTRFEQLLKRRETGEPIAYILGSKEFYGRDFVVNPAVLIPRPETELIVERALNSVTGESCPTLIDIGVGSGAIICSILLELQTRFGKEFVRSKKHRALDISSDAIAVALTNVRNLGLDGAIDFVEGDMLEAAVLSNLVAHTAGPRLVVSNPPYVAEEELLGPEVENFEPGTALWAKSDGLEFISEIISQLVSPYTGVPLFTREDVLLIEIGDKHRPLLDRLLRKTISGISSAGSSTVNSTPQISFHRDLWDIDRVLEVRF